MKSDSYAELRRVARRRSQRGCFTSAQAQAAGITHRELTRLVARGIVTREAPRVYRLGVPSVRSWKDPLAVELLRAGGRASGLSSAALYELADPPSEPSVIVPRGSRSAVPGRHTTRELASGDCVVVDGLRALSPTRTILDAVHRLPRHEAIALVEKAIVKGLVTPLALRRRATELSNAKRPGCALTVRILDDLHPELTRSRNEWEALVARRAEQFSLPRPALEYEHDFMDAGWLRFGITAPALQRRDDRSFAQVARAIARRSPHRGLHFRPHGSETPYHGGGSADVRQSRRRNAER